MKIIQFQTSHKIILAALLITLFGLLSVANVQGTSHKPFTITEIRAPAKWQYRAVANSAPGGFSRWQDSPWHWRHYGGPVWAGEGNINCDDTLALFPADPTSPDTAVSADGGTVTVNIYQGINTVWVCFALECDDGTYAYAKMKNTQEERTVTSGPCGQGAPGTGTTTVTTTVVDDPPEEEEEEEEEEETTITNPLVPPADPVNSGNNNPPQQTQTQTETNNPDPDPVTPSTTIQSDPEPVTTPETDNDEGNRDEDPNQDNQDPKTEVVVVETPTVRTKQYQGDWK